MQQELPSVENVVLQLIRDIVGRNREFALASTLVGDLRISSDDLTMYLVPELERRLNVNIPVHEWRTVETGQDACMLVRKYLPEAS
jgi:hypothetical protein